MTGKSTALTRRRDRAIEKAGPDFVYGLVSEGRSVREIADALGLDGDDERTRWAIRNWLRRDSERYDAARRDSVDALAERAFDIYGDEAPESTADASWRDRKAGHLRWLADLRAGRVGGSVNVNVDIGQLHLDALRAHGHMDRNPDRVTVEAEYEVEDASPDDDRARESAPKLGELP